MAHYSKRRDSAPKVPEPAPVPTLVAEHQRRMASAQEGVSLSLKYFRREAECFSEWSPADLKKFSAAIEKMRGLTAMDLRLHPTLCQQHKHPPAAERFAGPPELSKDLSLFEIRVDGGEKARIHGAFIGSVFHLVWLDRHHQVYPTS